MTTRVALYARVSTVEQQSLEAQLVELRAYANARGWSIVREVSEVGSGAKERPKRDELLNAGLRREYDAIAVWSLSRWGRSAVDVIATVRALHYAGVQFVSLKEAIDASSPMGKAMLSFMAAFAELERDQMKERQTLGIAHAKANGKHCGRPKLSEGKRRLVLQLRETNPAWPLREIARVAEVHEKTVRRVLKAQSHHRVE